MKFGHESHNLHSLDTKQNQFQAQEYDLHFFRKLIRQDYNGIAEIHRIHFLGTFLSNKDNDKLSKFILFLNQLTKAPVVYMIYNYGNYSTRVYDNSLFHGENPMNMYNAQPKYYCRFNRHTCEFVQVIFPMGSEFLGDWERSVLPKLSRNSQQLPYYVLYISEYTINDITTGKATSFYKLMMGIRFTSIKFYVVTSQNSTRETSFDLYMGCLHCNKYNELLVEIPNSTSKSLRHIWRNVHNNANLAYAASDLLDDGPTMTRTIGVCDGRPISERVSFCILYQTMDHLNLTLGGRLPTSSGVRILAYINIGWNWLSDKSYLYVSRSLVKTFGYRSPYKFAVILDQSQLSLNNYDGLINTMDSYTWMFVLLSFLSTIVALAFVLPSGVQSIPDVVFQLFGTFLFQGIRFPINKLGATVIITTWFLALIVISNGYSSILSGLMVKPKIPDDYPTNLESLAASNFSKFTFAEIINPNKRRLTLLENDLLNLLVSENNSEETIEIQQLKNIVSKTEGIFYHEYNFMTMLNTKKCIFIEADRYSEFEILVNLAKIFGKVVPIQDTIVSSLLYAYTATAYFVEDTYLQESIISLLNIICESGMFTQWRKAWKDSQVNIFTINLNQRMQTASKNASSNTEKEFYAKFLAYINRQEIEPLKVSLIGQIFYLYFGIIVVSIVVFCFEIAIYIFVLCKVISSEHFL